MPDVIALVSRQLNDVQSVGEARAAIESAQARLEYGLSMISALSRWTSPSPSEWQDTLIILQGALNGEAAGLSASAPDSAIDPTTWARVRRQVERSYIEVSGVEGQAGATANVDVVQILGDAIANAPKVFLGAVGEGVGEVLKTAGEAAAGQRSTG